jgi:hypothetical protein
VHNKPFKIPALLIISALIILSGCGNGKPTKSQLKAMGLLCSFEKLQTESQIGDFNWETHGYVKLEQFKKHATQGKFSAKAVFSVPADFLTDNEVKKTTVWNAGMTMDLNTLTRLPVTDWSVYKKFDVDIYSDNDKDLTFYIKLNDMNGKEYIISKPVKKGKNKLELVIEDVKTQRVDINNIVSLTLYIDTKAEPLDITLYIDNVRLMP